MKILKSAQLESKEFELFERDSFVEESENLDPTAILAEARLEAEAKVKEAYAEGMRRGTEAGEKRFKEAIAESSQALQSAAAAMKEAQDNYLVGMEPQVVALAHAIASRVLEREATIDSELILATARKALRHLVDRERLAVRVNPVDLEVLRTRKIALLEEFDGVEALDVIADSSVNPGGCVVESKTMQLDAQLDAQLEEILKALME